MHYRIILFFALILGLSAEDAKPPIIITSDEEAWLTNITEPWLKPFAETGVMPGPVLVLAGFPSIPVPDHQGRFQVLAWQALLDSSRNPTRLACALLGQPSTVVETPTHLILTWSRPCLVTRDGRESGLEASIAMTLNAADWRAFPFPPPSKPLGPHID